MKNRSAIQLLVTFLLLSSSLTALEILQSVGSQNRASYIFITLEEATPFGCALTPPSLNEKGELLCRFEKIPAIRPRASKNSFFSIEPALEAGRFYVRIRFLKKALVHAVEEKTLSAKPLSPSDLSRRSKRWLIVGYEQTPPVLEEAPKEGLGFAVALPPFDPPAVGPLDIAGAPVYSDNSQDDAQTYAHILEAYKAPNLPEALRLINRSLETGRGRNLFLPEMVALKIKILDQLGNNEMELIEIAEPWVKAYTVHHELPEVMLLLANALMKIGRSGDAIYYYETLIREYPANRFADLATVYRSDRVLSEGRVGEAIDGYEKVLFNSSDIPAAALAASRLADLAVTDDDIPKAAELYEKILQSYPEFFLDDIDKSRQLLGVIADQRIFAPAARLAEILLPKIETSSPEYEAALLNLARWQRMGGFETKALKTYERYLEEFPFSAQKEVIEKEYDLLQFDQGMETPDERLALYERILERYPDDEAASRALYEKAKLLLQLGRYAEVKALLPSLDKLDEKLFHDYRQQIRQMERTLLDSFLLQDRCAEAVSLVEERKIHLALRIDEPLYRCAHQEQAYTLAIDIADANLMRTSKAEGIEWLERRMDSLHAMSDYVRYIDAAERFLRMQRALRQPVEADRYYQLFSVYHRLRDNPERMKELAGLIEHRFPRDPRNMDLYAALIGLGKRQGDLQLQYDYAKKLVNRHRILSVRTFTPESELAFAEAASKLGKTGEAIMVLQTMLQQELAPADRARALFALGGLLQSSERAEMADAVFKRCADLGLEDDPWALLCRQKTAL